MRKLVVAAVLVMVLALVVAGTVMAITHGELDGEGHPYVGLVLFYDESGEYLWRCSGTLISSRVFLTAAHCTAPDPYWGTPVSARVFFDSDLSELVYPYPDCGPYQCYTGTPYPHPNYANFAGFPNTYDVGVVVFRRPIRMSTYGQLPELGVLDEAGNSPGQGDIIVRTVGYGLQSGEPHVQSERVRYTSTSMIIELNSANTGGYGLHTSNNPGQANGTGGSCSGDSGGPIFYPEDSNIVVGIVSWGMNYNCVGADYGYRVDIPDAQDFIYQYLR
jgi:hypothetical protein